MNRDSIIKGFQPSLSEESLRIIQLFSAIEERVNLSQGEVNKINLKILERQAKLKHKLSQTELKINSALFGDKKFFTETYSYEVPIDPAYFEGENFSIREGILTPRTKLKSDINKKPIKLSSISSRRETDFKVVDGKLYIEKNLKYPYQEIEVHLPKDLSVGTFFVNFDRFEKMSVLDRFGKELEDSAIRNSIVLPVSSETKSVVIRFETNKNKAIQLTDMYVAENMYEDSSVVQTKPISIGQYLREIGINTCDNYSDPNVDIHYYLSINGGEFREIRPLNKHRNLDLNTILPTDDTTQEVKLDQALQTDLGVMYFLDHLDSPDFHVIRSFKGKIGDNVGRTQNSPVSFYLEEPLSIILNSGSSLRANGELLEASEDGTEITFQKGFNTIQVDALLWNQKEDPLRYELSWVDEKRLKMVDKNTGEVLFKDVADPKVRGTESVFLQLYGKTDLYVDEFEAEEVYINNTRYIKKVSANSSYLFIKYKTRYVDTVQLKIDMKKNNASTPAYMSSLMIRGV